MRTTLACQWCRRSKIKCHHDGTPPCKSCRVHPGRECSLSTPVIRRKRNTPSRPPANTARANRVSKPVIGEASASRRTEKRNTSLQIRQSPPAFSTPSAISEAERIDERQSNALPQQLKIIFLPENALENVERKLVIRASRVFVQQFPEFGFVHKPTFFEYGLQDGVPAIKFCAIMALCARYIPELVDQYSSPYLASEHFADVVRENIMSYMAQHSGIDAVHALILLSLYDWGEGNGFQAWVYTGMATRMAQGIYLQTKTNTKDASCINFTKHETIIRTVWACFVLDCILRCGRCGSQRAEIEVPDIPLPMGEDDFEFGSQSTLTPHFLVHSGTNTSIKVMGSDGKINGPQQILSLIVKGFSIFSTLSTWICRGGRRYPSPDSIEPPWKHTSFWSRSMTTVEAWRGTHSSRLVYSRSGGQMQAHILHNQVESFALLNLLYYMSVFFLHREYTPFFPHRVSRPCGPIDPPLLEEVPPHDWWHHSAQKLFEATSIIIQLMQDLETRDVQFQTPFTAFCMFSAASAVLYADTWPYMAPGLENAKEKYTWSLDWLRTASEKWKIAKCWCEILGELSGIFTRLKTDGHDFPHLGREEFQDLHDNLHRLAEPESTTVNALAVLSQGAPLDFIGAACQSRLEDTDAGNSGLQSLVTSDTDRLHEVHNATSEQNQANLLVSNDDPQRMHDDTGIDTDFLMAMLSDPSGNWSHVL